MICPLYEILFRQILWVLGMFITADSHRPREFWWETLQVSGETLKLFAFLHKNEILDVFPAHCIIVVGHQTFFLILL